MKKVQIKDGMYASAISVGCMRNAGFSPKELNHFIHTALEHEVNFYDHADIYADGEAEIRFGQALRLTPGLRDKILLQSKCGICNGYYDLSKQHILECVDRSLQRLQVERLDLLLLHRPDALFEPDEIAEAFDTLEKNGKVGAFGVSNFNASQMKLLQKKLKQRLFINQLQFGIMHSEPIDAGIYANTSQPGAVDRDGAIFDYARMENLTIQVWSPLQYGTFSGCFVGHSGFKELNGVLEELAQKYHTVPSSIALAWIMRYPAKMQILCGTTSEQKLVQSCEATEIELTREEWYRLYRAAGHNLP